jgi:hypothetical protein
MRFEKAEMWLTNESWDVVEGTDFQFMAFVCDNTM